MHSKKFFLYQKMKTSKFLKLLSLVGVVAFATSCAKQQDEVRLNNNQEPAEVKKANANETLNRLARTLKNTGENIKSEFLEGSVTYTTNSNGSLTFTKNSEPFSFQNAPKGVTFTSSVGVKYSKSENAYVFADPNAISLGGGGSISVGDDNFDVDLAFCFSASSEGGEYDGLSPFDGEFGEVSGAMGIAGLSALINDASSASENEARTTNTEDLLKDVVIVQYLVFAKEASGEYKVTNFIDANEDSSDLESVSIGMVYKLGTGEIYLSNSGTFSINGGSISFNGEYIQLGDLDLLGDEDVDFSTVSGSGKLTCE